MTILTLKICMYFCFIHFLITILMVLFHFFFFVFSVFGQISIIDSFSLFSAVQSTSGVSEVGRDTAPTCSEVDPSWARIQGVHSKGRRKFNGSSKTVGSPLNGDDVAKGQQTNQQDQSDDTTGWPFWDVSFIASVKGGGGCISAFQSLFSHGACVCESPVQQMPHHLEKHNVSSSSASPCNFSLPSSTSSHFISIPTNSPKNFKEEEVRNRIAAV